MPQPLVERAGLRRVASHHVRPLGDALKEAFLTVGDLEQLLRSDELDKRFDDLTSRALPQGQNARDIASQAFVQGWASELLSAARALQPDNPALRALWAKLPEGDDEVPPDDDRDDRPSLLCGRGVQWNEVCQAAPARQHQVILIAGAEGQDPLHFRDRIHLWLGHDPRRSILLVDWPTRPASRAEFFEALGAALKVNEALLATTIAERLVDQNLVLLHDCVALKFNDDSLVKYYTEWLPELVEHSPNTRKLKAVQPIEWTPGQRSLLTRLFSAPQAEADTEDGARGLIDRLVSGAAASMAVISLTELTSLTTPEIDGFVRTSGLTPKQQALMLERVKSVQPVPARIFKTIDAYWSQVEAAR